MKRRVLVSLVAALVCVLAPAALFARPFQMWVTVSPPGPDNNNPATWGGIIRYRFENNGAPGTSLGGIDRSLVADPCGLVFRVESHELFVGNRHGNTGGGSISRFVYDAQTDSFTPNGSITGNGLYGVHQLALNPVTGELFATNYGGGVSRFLFDQDDNAVPNGMIGGAQWTRGVAVSPDGSRLYVTSATAVIRRFDLGTGLELPSVGVEGAFGLHFIRLHGEHVFYVADPTTSMIYKYDIDDAGNFSGRVDIAAPSAAGEAVSPDGLEMFATGHLTSHQITRLRWDGGTQSWTPVTPIYPGVPMGDILASAVADLVAVAEPAPEAVRLFPNQPNPFNPTTTIKYRVPVDGRVTLRIYDVRGALVGTLIDAELPRGNHQATWDGRDASGRGIASGSYFARLEAGGRVETVRMSLVR
ncbi:MAG: FlgD immunoglobulin-like domain containing protein [Deltaproteobacteria bacterium]|nr:FlgD immunoglobulin-like domain containing protein [Deltaproteobacteria bacterium]